jgi:hypothetical protein
MKSKRMNIGSLTPINLDSEKEKFLFDQLYNPQFVYEENIPPVYLHRYGSVEETYLAKAKGIMDSVIKKWGTDSAFTAEVEGPLIGRDEVVARINEYLKELGLEKTVLIRFSKSQISRTHVDDTSLNIRLPIEYRSLSFQGVLDHEIGTHILRRLNEKKQPWDGQRDKFGFLPYLETEEGLAAIHSHISMKNKQMWLRAVLYYAAHLAERMSFSDLNSALKPYVELKERRWNICVRVKRGISDTSIPGVFPKDQVYLKGSIRMVKWLEAHDYDVASLYLGKIDANDIHRAGSLSPDYQPLLPIICRDKDAYRDEVRAFAEVNGLL